MHILLIESWFFSNLWQSTQSVDANDDRIENIRAAIAVSFLFISAIIGCAAAICAKLGTKGWDPLTLCTYREIFAVAAMIPDMLLRTDCVRNLICGRCCKSQDSEVPVVRQRGSRASTDSDRPLLDRPVMAAQLLDVPAKQSHLEQQNKGTAREHLHARLLWNCDIAHVYT